MSREASPASKALKFLERLEVPEGPNAGRKLKLAPFQTQFVRGALAADVNVGCLSIGRGNGKSALSAGIALAALLGELGREPRREIPVAARTREQASVIWKFVGGFALSLPEETRQQLRFRRSPKLEIEYDGDGGGHTLTCVAADGKSVLGGSPTLAILDERGHWEADKGDALEHALMTGLGKRNGRALIVSTSAPDDAHPFSKWIDTEAPGVYRKEHRPAPGLPADDKASLLTANPGAICGIGAEPAWLLAQARRAIARGGSTLTSFRLFNRNERVSGETRALLLTVDEWLNCECTSLPPREGACIIGIDLGGSAAMSAAAYYWPETGRLEVLGTFPSRPSLLHRGQADSVGQRYCEMEQRGELGTLGDATVPVAAWLAQVMRRVEGLNVGALVADRYKKSELAEAIDAAGVRCPIVWRGMGFRDGGEDCERFQRACYDGRVKSAPSLLLRSAFSDAVTLKDPANNMKLAKSRSTGRIDAASASVLAVAEGARRVGRVVKPGREATWA